MSQTSKLKTLTMEQLRVLIPLFSMIVTGILRWMHKHKTAAIASDRREKSTFTVLSPHTRWYVLYSFRWVTRLWHADLSSLQEENILKKANQKRLLEGVAIEGGNFNTDFFSSVSLQEIVARENSKDQEKSRIGNKADDLSGTDTQEMTPEELERALASVEDEEDVAAAQEARREIAVEGDEFRDSVVSAVEVSIAGGGAGSNSRKRGRKAKTKMGELALSEKSQVAQIIQLAGSVSHSKEVAEEGVNKGEVENRLTPLQRYAFKFLEEIDGIVDIDQFDALAQKVARLFSVRFLFS